jgi:hypothetical protein
VVCARSVAKTRQLDPAPLDPLCQYYRDLQRNEEQRWWNITRGSVAHPTRARAQATSGLLLLLPFSRRPLAGRLPGLALAAVLPPYLIGAIRAGLGQTLMRGWLVRSSRAQGISARPGCWVALRRSPGQHQGIRQAVMQAERGRIPTGSPSALLLSQCANARTRHTKTLSLSKPNTQPALISPPHRNHNAKHRLLHWRALWGSLFVL